MHALIRHFLRSRGAHLGFAVLLALGPFLHVHFGVAHLTGFHLDGLDALEHVVPSGDLTHEAQFTPGDLESPSVGVASSVSRSLTDDFLLLAAAWLLAAALGIRLRAWPPGPRPGPAHTRARRLIDAGQPPPALAPPSGY